MAAEPDQDHRPGMASRILTGASKSMALPLCSPVIGRCRRPTRRAIPTSPSPSRLAPYRLTQPSTPRPERELFKQCALAVTYGMEAEGLAGRIGQPAIVGATCCDRTMKPIANSGAGPTPRLTMPCSLARSRPRSAGRCTWARTSIHARCGIFLAGERRRNAAACRLLCHRARY